MKSWSWLLETFSIIIVYLWKKCNSIDPRTRIYGFKVRSPTSEQCGSLRFSSEKVYHRSWKIFVLNRLIQWYYWLNGKLFDRIQRITDSFINRIAAYSVAKHFHWACCCRGVEYRSLIDSLASLFHLLQVTITFICCYNFKFCVPYISEVIPREHGGGRIE